MSNTITEIFDTHWTVTSADTSTHKLSIFQSAIRAITVAMDQKIHNLEQDLASRDAKIAKLEEVIKTGEGEGISTTSTSAD